MTIKQLLMGLVVALFVSSPAYADFATTERELLSYIEKETGYDTTGVQARYAFWTKERINQVYYGEKYEGQNNIIALHLSGLIVLPEDYDVEKQPEILLHELFHLVVFQKAIPFECLAEEERHAYQLHTKYVDEVRGGVGIKPSPLFVMLLRCNPMY